MPDGCTSASIFWVPRAPLLATATKEESAGRFWLINMEFEEELLSETSAIHKVPGR